MQSLESTCQEADYILNDGFCKLKKSSIKQQTTLLLDQYQSNVSSPPATTSSSSSSTHHSRSISGQSEKRGATDTSLSGSSPTKKSRLNSSSSTSTFLSPPLGLGRDGGGSSSVGGGTSNGGGGGTSSHNHHHHHHHHNHQSINAYNIHDRLRELYYDLINEDNSNGNKLKLRNTSFLLEKLVLKDKLNTLILNLYPGNKGYSLAFYLNKKTNDTSANQHDNSSTTGGSTGGGTSNSVINSRSSSRSGAALLSTSSSTNNFNSNLNLNSNTSSSGNNSSGNTNISSSSSSSNENLQETMRWPYEEEDLLESIDNEELPLVLVDIIDKKCPNLFYSGCVIVEVRDYRQSFPIYTCDTYHVLLRPTNQTIFADVNLITAEGDWTVEDKLQLESQLVLATSQPLCLDPNPEVGILSINQQHRRNLLNTRPIRRQAKKYSQVSINRKRKLDQFTHNHGLELNDFLQKYRQKPTRPSTSAFGIGQSAARLLKKPAATTAESIQPICSPNLDLPADLAVPEEVNVEKYAKVYERPRETKDCQPQLIEQYILETDRGEKQIYHIQLSLFQRPSNYEFLGELYVDKNHRDGERNGEACQFTLGSRAQASRYIQQFTEIFTEKGKKSVKITHNIPGKPPRISFTANMREHRHQQQIALQQQQQQQQYQAQQQHIQQLHPITAAANQQQHAQIITAAGPSNTIINIRPNPQQQQQHHLLHTQQQQQQQQIQNATVIYENSLPGQQTMQQHGQVTVTGQQQQQQTTTTHLNLSNGSLLLVQQPSGNITNLTINPQQQNVVSQNRGSLISSVPILQAQLQSHTMPTQQQQQQQHQQIHITQQQQPPPKPPTPTIHSTNPEINALATGLMNSANQFQQQVAASKLQQQQAAAAAAAAAQQQHQQHQQQQQQSSNSNAAIISLLNSAPAAMTNTPVLSSNQIAVDNLLARKSNQDNTILQHQQLPQNLFSTTTAGGGSGATVTRKIVPNQHQQQIQQQQGVIVGSQQQQQVNAQRILNHSNLIAVSSVGNQTQLINLQPQSDGTYHATTTTTTQHQQQSGQQPQQHSVRVTMSALATQLASPPAIMTSPPIIQSNQTQNFTINTYNPSQQQQQTGLTKQQQVLLNNVGSRIISTQHQQQQQQNSMLHRGENSSVTSPGSDSNASNNSSNIGYAMPGLNALLTTTPSPVSIDLNPGSNNSALIERLTSPSTAQMNAGQFTIPSPKNITIQQQQHQQGQQHIQVQSPASISPLSSPPPQQLQQQQQQQQQQPTQTTTLNLQGLNLASLQGAISSIPGLQNVQVQIPGLPQPISLSLSGPTNSQSTLNPQQTSLLVSVPVTNTTQVNQIQAVPSGVLGSTTQTVVLANTQSAGGTGTTNLLSLPIAQLVASGQVKGLNQQTLRAAASNAGNQPFLLGTIQRPRGIQVTGSGIVNQKQLTGRGLVTPQRNITNSTLKIATPLNVGQNQLPTNLQANSIVMTPQQQLQLKLQKQSQLQQQLQQQQQQQMVGGGIVNVGGGGGSSMTVMPQSSISPPIAVPGGLNTTNVQVTGGGGGAGLTAAAAGVAGNANSSAAIAAALQEIENFDY